MNLRATKAPAEAPPTGAKRGFVYASPIKKLMAAAY